MAACCENLCLAIATLSQNTITQALSGHSRPASISGDGEAFSNVEGTAVVAQFIEAGVVPALVRLTASALPLLGGPTVARALGAALWSLCGRAQAALFVRYGSFVI